MQSRFLELTQSLQINAESNEQFNILEKQAMSGQWTINIDLIEGIIYCLNLTCINFNNYQKRITVNVNVDNPNTSINVNVNCLGLNFSKTEIVINGNGWTSNASGCLNIHVNGIIDSNDAIITGMPNFNFCTNKINAKHGLVIGNINLNELNYLLSRGINEKMAKYLLVSTKLFRVLDDLDDNIKNQHQHAIMHIWEKDNYA